MNAKETDQRTCNIHAVSCAMLRRNFTSCRGPALQQATSGQSPDARAHGGPELAKSGHMADKERTYGGQTRGRHKRRTGFGGNWRRGQSGHVTQDGHMADTRQTWRTRGKADPNPKSSPATHLPIILHLQHITPSPSPNPARGSNGFQGDSRGFKGFQGSCGRSTSDNSSRGLEETEQHRKQTLALKISPFARMSKSKFPMIVELRTAL